MKTKEEKAIEGFRSGLNCAQAVLKGYSDTLRFDNEFALNISAGFGGGMGRLQETCGAVTGSYMVLGVYNGMKYTDNKDKKEFTYSMIQKFSDKFISLNGTTNCRALLKCDLRTEEGMQLAHENNLFEEVCEKCIADSFKIIDELIALSL
jgi:C_GCAxxG_C_C family probable redox protein